MSRALPQTHDAASNLPDDSLIDGIPLRVIRQIAIARKNVKNGFVKLHVVHDRDDRITIEESIMLPRAN